MGPLIAAPLACVAYAAVYAVMLTCATLVRSAALCAAAGGVSLVLGVIAGFRRGIAPVLEEGGSRTGFELHTLFLRVWRPWCLRLRAWPRREGHIRTSRSLPGSRGDALDLDGLDGNPGMESGDVSDELRPVWF